MTYDIHPIADLFPLLDGEDFAALVEDIKVNGLLQPIEYQGNTIIDGRNRLRACEAAGVVPEYRELAASVDPVQYICSRNVHRRHLTTAQRAAIAAEMATMSRGGDRGNQYTGGKGSNDPLPNDDLSIEQAARAMSVSAPSVKRAKKRMAEDPQAHEAIKKGEKPKKPSEDTTMGNPIKSKRPGWMFWKQAVQAQFIEDIGTTIGNTRMMDVRDHIEKTVEWWGKQDYRAQLSPDQVKEVRGAVHQFILDNTLIDDKQPIHQPSTFAMIDHAIATADSTKQDLDETEQTKLDRAINAHRKVLDLQFEQRVKEHMEEILKLYAEEYDRYKAFNDAYTGAFTDDEYRLLLSVLHPDRCQPERAKQFAKAFHLIKSKEEVLCKVKPNDRPTTLPSTIEELIARKKRH